MARDEVVAGDVAGHGDLGFEEGHVDALSFACFFAREEGGEDGTTCVESSAHVSDGDTCTHRFAIGCASDAHEAAEGLGHEVVARAIFVGAGVAVAGDGAVDETGADLLQSVVIEAHFVEGAGAEVFDEDVGCFDEFSENGFALVGFEVEGEASFVAVGGEEVGGLPFFGEGWPPVASVVAATGHFDFDAKLLAGGQSLVPVMNFRLAQPTMIVDLNNVPGLAGIERDGDVVRVGGMVRHRTLEFDGTIAESLPLLHGAMPYIAHPQIRNRGTFGGSIAHADPAGELPVMAVVLNGRFQLQRQGSSRWVKARDFFRGLFDTDLEPEEILTAIELPMLPARTGYAFLELARRHGDYAQAGVAVTVTLDEAGVCSEARLVYLNVGEIPMVAGETAVSLQGQKLTDDVIQSAAEMATQNEIEPTGDVHATADYKRHLAKVLTVRALKQAIAKVEG